MSELTQAEREALAREVAADNYDRQWPMQTSYGDIPRAAFMAGWDAAIAYSKEHADGPPELVK